VSGAATVPGWRISRQPEMTDGDRRNWILLAFRALNDADQVLRTIDAESCAETARLFELRERIGALQGHVPVLLGMGRVLTERRADEAVGVLLERQREG
jgi:hypothetical protein